MSNVRRNSSHLQKWGAAYILALLFLGSWVGQFFAQMAEVNEELTTHGELTRSAGQFLVAPDFWAATFENWQSEWLQLFVQAVLVVGLANVLFRTSQQDIHRIEAKVDRLLVSQGIDLPHELDVD